MPFKSFTMYQYQLIKFVMKQKLQLVLFLAACFNFSFSLVFVWSCHFSFY